MSTKSNRKNPYLGVIIPGCFLVFAALITGLLNIYSDNIRTGRSSSSTQLESTLRIDDTLIRETAAINTGVRPNPIYLTNENVRQRIQKLLRQDSITTAVELVKYISLEDDRVEEYEHIANYCVKNGLLDKAEQVAGLLNNIPGHGEIKENIIIKINLERLKNR